MEKKKVLHISLLFDCKKKKKTFKSLGGKNQIYVTIKQKTRRNWAFGLSRPRWITRLWSQTCFAPLAKDPSPSSSSGLWLATACPIFLAWMVHFSCFSWWFDILFLFNYLSKYSHLSLDLYTKLFFLLFWLSFCLLSATFLRQ